MINFYIIFSIEYIYLGTIHQQEVKIISPKEIKFSQKKKKIKIEHLILISRNVDISPSGSAI